MERAERPMEMQSGYCPNPEISKKITLDNWEVHDDISWDEQNIAT
jgi:hypothetical protein